LIGRSTGVGKPVGGNGVNSVLKIQALAGRIRGLQGWQYWQGLTKPGMALFWALANDLWHVLRKSVGKRKQHLAGRLLVCDSKKAYSRAVGVRHLERTALAFLRCACREPGTSGELLRIVCPDLTERLANYPWYSEAGNYRIVANQADIALASQVLKDDLASHDMEFLTFRGCCLDVAYYNKMVSVMKNKARVLFGATTQLIKHIYDNYVDDELQVVVDRQGGRIRYRRDLQRMFPEMELQILCESASTSSYELKEGSRKMRLHFEQVHTGASDRQHKPVLHAFGCGAQTDGGILEGRPAVHRGLEGESWTY
jgi:hypothetical protein